MIKSLGSKPVTIALVAALGAAAAVGLTSSPAFAASSTAGKNGFDRSGKCDANVAVSDVTSYGKVEVFGGFVCPTGSGLFNEPTGATIRVRMYKNGVEILQSLKNVPTGNKPFTISSDFHAITYPDYSSTDRFKGVIEISSLSGSVKLTTGEITT